MGLCPSLIICDQCLHLRSGWKRYPTCQTQTVHTAIAYVHLICTIHRWWHGPCSYVRRIGHVAQAAKIAGDYLGNTPSSHLTRSGIIAHILTWLSARSAVSGGSVGPRTEVKRRRYISNIIGFPLQSKFNREIGLSRDGLKKHTKQRHPPGGR